MRSCQWKSFVWKASLPLVERGKVRLAGTGAIECKATQDVLQVHRNAELAEHLRPVSKVLVAALDHVAQLERVVCDRRPAAKVQAQREELALRAAAEDRGESDCL